MQTKTKVLSLSALLAAGTVFGVILAGNLDLTKRAAADRESAPAPAAEPARAGGARGGAASLPSFADLAEQAMPAVVTVTSTDIVKGDKRRTPFHRWNEGQGEGSPWDFFFGPSPDRRGGDGSEEEDHKEMSGGTGFLIEPDGFVLTNNHVIDGADKVDVKVGDQDEYRAKVVGRDPATDLALLKIEGAKPFPVLKLGDSDRLRVGEWVMAIGDPLQFEKTVTVGVVSGKGRFAGLSRATRSFENLIQTDAAINFGNSGGPLVNAAGEVVGINTAISRVAQNIGFAVPINVAKRLLPQLKKGKVVRGFLGVGIAPVDKKFQEVYGLKSAEGALVQSVEKGKPGEKAGLKREDVILKVDDVPVKSNRDLIDYVASKAPGTKVTLTFVREGKERTTVATLEARDEEAERVEEDEERKAPAKDWLGITVDELSPALRRSYRLDKEIANGVVVTHVKPVSPAADAGLLEGDVILEVNGVEIENEAAYRAEQKKVKGRYVRLYVGRSLPRYQTFIAAVKLEE